MARRLIAALADERKRRRVDELDLAPAGKLQERSRKGLGKGVDVDELDLAHRLRDARLSPLHARHKLLERRVGAAEAVAAGVVGGAEDEVLWQVRL